MLPEALGVTEGLMVSVVERHQAKSAVYDGRKKLWPMRCVAAPKHPRSFPPSPPPDLRPRGNVDLLAQGQGGSVDLLALVAGGSTDPLKEFWL